MKPSRQHSFLYIVRPGGEAGEYECVGESNSAFPVLWRVLLAADRRLHGPAIDEVMDGATRQNVAVDAQQSLERVDFIVDHLLSLASLEQVEGVQRYLSAARAHLQQLVGLWHLPDETPPALLATLDEMPVEDAETEHAVWRADWRRIEAAARGSDPHAVLNELFSADARLTWREWRAWSGVFGLALFTHDYFASAFRAPHAHDFDHVSPATALDGDWQLCREGAKVGVRHASSRQVALQPVYDHVVSAGLPNLVWIRCDKNIGLAHLSTEGADVLCEPTFQDVSNFVRSRAVVMKDEHYGFLTEEGCLIVRPQFDEVDDYSAAGIARVRRKHGWGLIDLDGRYVLRAAFDHLEWVPELPGWLAITPDKALLRHADGREWIAGRFTDIEVAVPQRFFRVIRNQRVGILDWQGEVVLPCEFDAVDAVELSDAVSVSATYFIVRKGGRVGLVNSAGADVLPCAFESIEPIEPHLEPDCCAVRPELLRVYVRQKHARPHAGIWNLKTAGWLVPCEYDVIWLLAVSSQDHRFIVATRGFDRDTETLRYSMGLLNGDGTPWIALEYKWIGDSVALTHSDARDYVREAIHFAWSRGRPVQALLAADGTLVWLYPDGTRIALEAGAQQPSYHIGVTRRAMDNSW